MEILLILLGVAFYFLPSIVGGKKRNTNAIFTLNLLLGWTVIGWIIALVWATTADPPLPAPVVATPNSRPLPTGETSLARAARLKELRDRGVLTQQEFMQQIQRDE